MKTKTQISFAVTAKLIIADDQLRGYHEADLRLCFRAYKLLVFLCSGSYGNTYCDVIRIINNFSIFTPKYRVTVYSLEPL